MITAISATHRISDYHLGAGVRLANGAPNLLENFKGDEDYARMLRKFVARFGPETLLRLEWGGDTVDFHAIPYRGAHASIPTVEAALAKFELCLKGHPAFWAATRHFLADKRHALVITIGNHDLEFAWPEVQERIRQELEVAAGDDRLRFVTTVIEGDTCKLHGDLFDPPNAVPPPESLFMTDESDGRSRRLLNVSYGNVLSASLLQALKARHPWIGRMENHGAVWVDSATREWRFGIKAILLWLGYTLQHLFFSKHRYIRRQTTLWQTIKLALSTFHEDRPAEYARNFLMRHPDVRYLESGHTHAPGVSRLDVGMRRITWFNTGTGIEQVRLTRPARGFFRRVILYWWRRPLQALGLTAIHLAVALLPFVVERWFGWHRHWLTDVVVGLAIFSWLLRQAFALYAAERHADYAVLETLEIQGGRVGPQLLHYDPVTGDYLA